MQAHRELCDVHISLFDECRRALAHELVQPGGWLTTCRSALPPLNQDCTRAKLLRSPCKLCSTYLWPLYVMSPSMCRPLSSLPLNALSSVLLPEPGGPRSSVRRPCTHAKRRSALVSFVSIDSVFAGDPGICWFTGCRMPVQPFRMGIFCRRPKRIPSADSGHCRQRPQLRRHPELTCVAFAHLHFRYACSFASLSLTSM